MMLQYCSLYRRDNLILVNNICEAALISLFWAPNGLNELSETRFEFPFILTGQRTMYGFFNRQIIAHTQILVHRWWPRTRISAPFGILTKPEFSFVCDLG